MTWNWRCNSLRDSGWRLLSLVLLAGLPGRAAADAPTDDDIRHKLHDIMARPEFSIKPRNNLLLRFLEAVGDVLGWLHGLREENPALYWSLVTACVILLLLVAAHVTWTMRRVLFAPRGLGDAAAAEEKRQRLSQACWEKAGRRAAARDFTEAIRFLFLALVYRFDESGRVLFQQAATNREYLALFADRPQLQAQLKVFVDTLDEYWYGQHPSNERQYQECLALYGRVN
jgi:hypothetical protein